MRKVIFLLLLTFTYIVTAQKESCESPEGSVVEDLNSITKCTIKPSKSPGDKKARQISVRVSAPKRFLKKRKKDATSLNGSGITATGGEEISKSVALKTNLSALTNTLSKEEIRSAQKFSTVDEVPSFTACKGEKGSDKVDCFNMEMIKHIQEHFSYPNEAMINKIEGEVWVRFIIDKDGNVTNIKALGPKGGKLLKDEAIRVVSNLPRFTPGVKDGKVTSVKYGFPINFSLEEN